MQASNNNLIYCFRFLEMEKDYYNNEDEKNLSVTTNLPSKGWDQEKVIKTAAAIIKSGEKFQLYYCKEN